MSLARLRIASVLVVLSTVLAAVAGAAPAAAQVPGDAEVAQVVLTGLDPSYATGDDVVTLPGRLTNRSDAPPRRPASGSRVRCGPT